MGRSGIHAKDMKCDKELEHHQGSSLQDNFLDLDNRFRFRGRVEAVI